jgi:hypothetical protein
VKARIAESNVIHTGDRFAFLMDISIKCAAALMVPASCLADMTLVSHVISGVVVEEGTGKPIPQAIVSAKWNGAWSSVAGGGTRCTKGIAARADESGRFSIPEWTDTHTDLDRVSIEATPYKPGYRDTKRGRVGARPQKMLGFASSRIEIPVSTLRLEMKPFAESEKERADFIVDILSSTECRETGDVVGMDPLYRAIREEVQALPPEIRDHKPRPSQATLLELVDRRYLSRTEGAGAGRSPSEKEPAR